MVGGDESASGSALEAAAAAGRTLAERGATLVCGGLGGVMEAACQGASEAGGLTVGILPGVERRAANPFVRVAVPTGLGEARNALVVRMADAVVAVDGEYGTLSEIALALKAGKPVVGVSTWELGRAGAAVDALVRVDGGEEAALRALELCAGG